MFCSATGALHRTSFRSEWRANAQTQSPPCWSWTASPGPESANQNKSSHLFVCVSRYHMIPTQPFVLHWFQGLLMLDGVVCRGSGHFSAPNSRAARRQFNAPKKLPAAETEDPGTCFGFSIPGRVFDKRFTMHTRASHPSMRSSPTAAHAASSEHWNP